MSTIKDGNFFVIQSFMVKDLKLKGTELFVYAIIYGFSQADNQCFTGTLHYLEDWTNCTKAGIIKVLKSLIQKGLISKNEQFVNGVKRCEYYVTEFTSGKQSLLGGGKQSLLGGKQSLPYNIDNNINIDNINNNSKELLENPQPKEKPKKSTSRYSKIIFVIKEFTDNLKLRDMLEQYLRMLTEAENKLCYVNQFVGKLNKLKELTDNEEKMIKIVSQSIQYGWKAFYPLKEDKKSEFKDNISSDIRKEPIELSEESF